MVLLGSIAGETIGSTIINCYNDENTIIEGKNWVGGIIGSIDGSTGRGYVYNSYNLAKVKGEYSGGIVGYCYSGAIDCINCYSKGEIIGINAVGGILGERLWFSNDNKIENCFYEKTANVNKGCFSLDIATGIERLTNAEIEKNNNYISNNINAKEWRRWKLLKNGYPVFE